jgi:hypothetical protein
MEYDWAIAIIILFCWFTLGLGIAIVEEKIEKLEKELKEHFAGDRKSD